MSGFIIETLNLSRKYGTLTAVDELNLNVPNSSVYGFLGPNGAGKTTTIRMLLGLIRPTQGQVRLFEIPLDRNLSTLLGRVGALVETPSLYPHLTGYENLEITRRLIGAKRERIKLVLSIVKMEQDAHRRVREYSHGMRQRMALALSLLNEPQLLILDEPTNGLDPSGIREMRELVRSLPTEYGITVFLSTHLLGEVEQIATHIGIISKGHLLFQGTLNELQAKRRERISLTVDQPKAAIQVLREAGRMVQSSGNNRLVVFTQGWVGTADINAMLVRKGINVIHLSVEQPSLEDIFLQLTQDQNGELKPQ
jgi:ABC-type multidrug transport system ATPase subunit